MIGYLHPYGRYSAFNFKVATLGKYQLQISSWRVVRQYAS